MTDRSPLPQAQLEGLKSALADRYLLEEEVGVGGMGVVYRARDVRHDRMVAIKILLPELAASIGTDRFLREIRIEAQLSHPHILPIYDSGEAGGLLFCVMPFVEGESLRDRLDREGQLPCDDALRIIREIADALAFAHARNLVHRDVKPANILLEAGHAVLADFGLARALTAVGDEGLTRTGFAVGTPAYSSPEQAAAERVDGRSDLYSLGCVFYEMLAGQPPFVGPSTDSVVRQHMVADPTPVSIIRPAVPEACVAMLGRLLAKSPADRYSSASDFIRDIDAAASGERPLAAAASKPRLGSLWKVAAPTAALVAAGVLFAPKVLNHGPAPGGVTSLDPRAVAVLYFDDLSPDGELQHVADGFTEELIGELARVNGLDVVSRNGSARFRDSSVSPDSIARALEVGTLVRGSVESVGDRLRVGVRLVEGSSGADIERRTFEVPAQELLAAQDSVVQDVAWLLRERLGEEIRLRRRQATANSVEAWALAQRGERERKRAEESLSQGDAEATFQAFDLADSLFALSAATDPAWVEPILQQGWTAYQRSRLTTDLETAMGGIERASEFADRALTLEPDEPRALELRGTVSYWHWLLNVTPDPEEAARLLDSAREDLEAAVDVDPSLASAYSTLSHLYYQVSDLTNALVSARLAYEADAFLSVAPEVLWRLFLASYDTERFTQARSWCQEGARRFPEDYRFSECGILELTLPAVSPDVERAWQLQDQAVERTPETRREYERHATMIYVADVLAHADLPDSARSVLLRARAGADVDPNMDLPFLEAHVRTDLGDYDEAVSLLSSYLASFDAGGEDDEGDWARHWWWRPLRDHPGFKELIGASG